MNKLDDHNAIFPTWYLIPLDVDFHGKKLFLRIFSKDNHFIGIERIFLGSEASFIKHLVTDRIRLVVFGFLFIITGLVPLLIFIKKRKEKTYFAFGLFTVSLGVLSS